MGKIATLLTIAALTGCDTSAPVPAFDGGTDGGGPNYIVTTECDALLDGTTVLATTTYLPSNGTLVRVDFMTMRCTCVPGSNPATCAP